MRFRNADHLVSFIGLVPMCHSSGESNGTGDITVRRHFMLRCLLVEAPGLLSERIRSCNDNGLYGIPETDESPKGNCKDCPTIGKQGLFCT